jgi:hypothetical protein
MHGRPHGHFDSFQIKPAILALVLPDHLQQTTYFARDFLLDGFGFFSGTSMLVQRTQLADSFVDGNQLLTEFLKTMEICHFSLPLPNPAGESKVSVMVLPFTFRVRRKLGPWPGSLAFAQ